jgi:hypothetical protein
MRDGEPWVRHDMCEGDCGCETESRGCDMTCVGRRFGVFLFVAVMT